MSVRTILGLDALLYRNTGTYGTPTWSPISDVKDVNLSIEKSEANTSTRQSQWGLVKGALKNATIEFQMVYDPADTNWAALKTAFLTNAAVEMAVADGPIATTGTEYFRASMDVLKWAHPQNLEEVIMTEITVKPCRSDNGPAWVVAT